MSIYVGVDVSQETTTLCIVDGMAIVFGEVSAPHRRSRSRTMCCSMQVRMHVPASRLAP